MSNSITDIILQEQTEKYTILKIVCDLLLRAFMFVSPKCRFAATKISLALIEVVI